MSVSLSRSTSYSASNSTKDELPNTGRDNQAAYTSPENAPIKLPATRVRILSAPSAQQSVPHRKSSFIFGENVDASTVLEARKVSTLPKNGAHHVSVNSDDKTAEIELQVLNDDISASSPQAIEPVPLNLSVETTDAFFKSLQAAEDALGTGKRYLKNLQDLGFKDDLLTKLSDSLDQIKDVIDRAQDLKQKINDHENS